MISFRTRRWLWSIFWGLACAALGLVCGEKLGHSHEFGNVSAVVFGLAGFAFTYWHEGGGC